MDTYIYFLHYYIFECIIQLMSGVQSSPDSILEGHDW